MALGADQLREAEVQDLHHAAVSEEDVRRLDVAVDDTGRVRVLEAAGDLPGDVERGAERQRTARDASLQGLALVAGHHQVRQAVRRLANLVDGADVLVFERRSGAGLLEEATLGLGVLQRGGGQDLDRDVAAEPRILRPVHDTHGAGSELGEHLVGPEGGTGRDHQDLGSISGGAGLTTRNGRCRGCGGEADRHRTTASGGGRTRWRRVPRRSPAA